MADWMKFVSPRLVAATMSVALITIASPSAADVKAGVDAWSAGNFELAVQEWEGPAAAGDPDAMFNLAQAYRLGRGVPASIEKARELYAQAALKGHVKAADNYGLLLFQQGEQVEAMPLIRAAAERGDPRAQYVLGLAHFNADYAEKDWVRAYALLTLAQSSGLQQASTALGQMDQYVPLEERQEAQLLARELDTRAERLRAAQMAQAELGNAPNTPATNQPVANSRPQVVQSQPAPLPPSPQLRQTVQQASAPASSDGPWRVQLGAFGVPGNADRLWNRLANSAALTGKRKYLVPSSSGKITKLLAGGFASRADAQRACQSLKAGGQDCLVTRS